MKILLLSRYGRMGASSRIRSYQFLPYLAAHGIDVTVAPLLGNEYIEALYTNRKPGLVNILRGYARRLRHIIHSSRFDLLWIEYELLPWVPFAVEKCLSASSPPSAVDYDDAIYHRYNLHSNPLVRAALGNKIAAVMRNAQLVIAGNDYLIDHARRAGAKDVAYLPTVVDTQRYIPAMNVERKAFTIGWIGSPMTAKFVDPIARVIRHATSDASARVVLVGAGQRARVNLPVEVRPWTEAEEVSDIQSFDVGIMPLPNAPFERGKCGYKLIQYMACGVPVIASPVGVNTKIVEDGVNGFLAGTPEEWARAISTLKHDPELRRRMGLAGRKKVEVEYSVQSAAPKLCSLLQRAAGNRGPKKAAIAAAASSVCVE